MKRGPPGFVLVMVLVVVMLASMVAASLLYLLRSEKTASAAGISGEQAWATAMSGVYQAMRIAAQSTPGSLAWRDNPASFKNQLLLDDGANQWYFTVYSVGDLDSSEIRFGLTDEASKINVNYADLGTLERLPNMTPLLAQVLMDYVQGHGTSPLSATEQSGDAISTNLLPNPGRKLSCLDELLHLSGFTSAVVYGEDANLNGNLDPNEDDGEATAPPDNQDAQLDFGLRPLLTMFSYDLNLNNDGQPRLNLNESETDLSPLQLPESVTKYIEALRRKGQPLAHPADLLEASDKFKDEKGAEGKLSSGVGKSELPVLLDRCTATNEARLPGLVNLNTASAKVLAALPGSDAALAEAIAAARIGLTEEARRTPAWLFQEGLVNADLFKKMAPRLTTRSFQFHFHVAAYAVPAGTYRVVEVVVDTAVQPPAIRLLRDLTRLGLPYGIGLLKEPVRQNPGISSGPKASPRSTAINSFQSRRRARGVSQARRRPQTQPLPAGLAQNAGAVVSPTAALRFAASGRFQMELRTCLKPTPVPLRGRGAFSPGSLASSPPGRGEGVGRFRTSRLAQKELGTNHEPFIAPLTPSSCPRPTRGEGVRRTGEGTLFDTEPHHG